jgi:hypothetical protein
MFPTWVYVAWWVYTILLNIAIATGFVVSWRRRSRKVEGQRRQGDPS